MSETKLAWAIKEFEKLVADFEPAGFLRSGENKLYKNQDPPSSRTLEIEFVRDPRKPYIRVAHFRRSELEVAQEFFCEEQGPGPIQAFYDVGEFEAEHGWVERGGSDGLLTTSDVAKRIERAFALI